MELKTYSKNEPAEKQNVTIEKTKQKYPKSPQQSHYSAKISFIMQAFKLINGNSCRNFIELNFLNVN